ncbi:MAG: MarR family transcriptional regulator [Ruminococcaceae bacterium]|nr:MarR family transcriptional regulator [Oscillospiraceae bacterium]
MAEITSYELLGLLHRVEKLSHRKRNNSCENFIGRGRILTTLSREDGLSQKILAERLDIRPQSLSETIVKLAEDKLVERVPSENDKRELLIYITDEGRVRASEIRARREAFAKDFFAPLSDEEIISLSNILKKIEEEKQNCENCDTNC